RLLIRCRLHCSGCRGVRGCRRIVRVNRLGIVISAAGLPVIRIFIATHTKGVRHPVHPPPGDAEGRRHGIIRNRRAGIPSTRPGAVIPVAVLSAGPVLPVFAGTTAILLAALLLLAARVLSLPLELSARILALSLALARGHAILQPR